MGEFFCSSGQAEWQTTALFGSQGSKQSDTTRALPCPHHRRCCCAITWREGIHEAGCQKWVLACVFRRGIIIPHYLQHTIWKVSLAAHALWYPPFGIRSAPEVSQRKMHELIEGMSNVEVVADDFVVVGYGQTHEEATRDHEATLKAFLKRCEAHRLKLNLDKLELRQTEVTFTGHVATGEGIRVDPAKVKAIRDMPIPTDKAGVQRLFGL